MIGHKWIANCERLPLATAVRRLDEPFRRQPLPLRDVVCPLCATVSCSLAIGWKGTLVEHSHEVAVIIGVPFER
jgi:hypothetical protein